MGKECPYCGSKDTVKDDTNNALLCNSCGKVSPLRKGEKSEFFVNKKLLTTIIIPIIITFIFIFSSSDDEISSDLLSLTTIFLPGAPSLWVGIRTTIFLVFLLIIAYSIWNARSFSSSMVMGIVWIVITITFLTIYPIVNSHLNTTYGSKYIRTLACMMTNFNNPQALAACQASTSVEDDESSIKTGNYNVVSIWFNTEYSGDAIYKSNGKLEFDTYHLPITIKSLSKDRTIENFYIKSNSKLRRSGTVTSAEKITLAWLEPLDGRCTEDNPCDLKPEESIEITLKATEILCENFDEDVCKMSGNEICEWTGSSCVYKEDITQETEAIVEFSYDYASEGTYDFVVAESQKELEPLLNNRDYPSSSDGPLDVGVYFTPSYYNKLESESGTHRINLIIELSKEIEGGIFLKKPIKISRYNDGALLPPENCVSPTGKNATLESLEDYKEQITINGPQLLKKSYTYICKYEIVPEKVGEQGKYITFNVRSDYRYETYAIKRFIDIKLI